MKVFVISSPKFWGRLLIYLLYLPSRKNLLADLKNYKIVMATPGKSIRKLVIPKIQIEHCFKTYVETAEYLPT